MFLQRLESREVYPGIPPVIERYKQISISEIFSRIIQKIQRYFSKSSLSSPFKYSCEIQNICLHKIHFNLTMKCYQLMYINTRRFSREEEIPPLLKERVIIKGSNEIDQLINEQACLLKLILNFKEKIHLIENRNLDQKTKLSDSEQKDLTEIKYTIKQIEIGFL